MPLRSSFLLPLVLSAWISAPAFAARMLPKAPPAARDLVVVDWEAGDRGDRTRDLSVRTLQGLANRQTARVWVGLEEREGSAGWWLKRYQEWGLAAEKPRVISAGQFLKRFKHLARGVVVPPENLGQGGYRVAVMRAAADGLIVGSRELAGELGLEVVEDYSTRFGSYAASWEYALEHLWDRLSHEAVFVDRDDLSSSTATVDYAVQQKLFLCAPHAGVAEEMKLFAETLRRLGPNRPAMGSAGGGGMINEGDIVRAVSKAGCVFAGCSGVSNLTVHAGMPGKLRRPKAPGREPPRLQRDKVYVAVELSDGDNANLFFTHIPRRQIWEGRGQSPFGWTMGQAITELAPAIAGYHYESRTEMDEFITGPSGYAYMFPGDYGNALPERERERAWREYLKRTDEFLAASGMSVISTLHFREEPGPAGDDVFARYAGGLNNARGIINGYNAVYQEYGGRTLQVIEGLPVFHTVTDRTWSEPGEKTLADEVMERTPRERPAFLALFMLPMALRPDRFEQVVDSLKRLEREGYVLTLPSELADLALEHARSKGR